MYIHNISTTNIGLKYVARLKKSNIVCKGLSHCERYWTTKWPYWGNLSEGRSQRSRNGVAWLSIERNLAGPNALHQPKVLYLVNPIITGPLWVTTDNNRLSSVSNLTRSDIQLWLDKLLQSHSDTHVDVTLIFQLIGLSSTQGNWYTNIK